MTWAFRSAGTVSSVFNTTTTPGAPAGFVAGDLLLVCGWCTASSITMPDLTSQGFTRLSPNAAFTYIIIWGRIATGGDSMPSFQMGPDFCASACLAYTGAPSTLTGIASQAGTERGGSAVNGCTFAGFTTPPDSNVMVFSLGMRNPGSSVGMVWGTKANYTNRQVQQSPDNRPHAIMLDWIQTTSTSASITNITSSPSDSVAQNNASQTIFLKPAPTAFVPQSPMAHGAIGVQMAQ